MPKQKTSQAPPTTADLKNKIISGERVVFRNIITSGDERIAMGNIHVVDADFMVRKNSLREGVAGSETENRAEIGRRVSEAQGKIREIREGIPPILDIMSTVEEGDLAMTERVLMATLMPKILDGMEIDVTEATAKRLVDEKPTYSPLFETEASEEAGRVKVRIKSAGEAVEQQEINAAWAVKRVAETIQTVLRIQSGDETEIGKKKKEAGSRVGEIHSAAVEILTNQMKDESGTETLDWVSEIPEGALISAQSMPLTMNVQLVDSGRVGGILLKYGGKGAHAYGFSNLFPTGLGAREALEYVATGVAAIFDQSTGDLILNPKDEDYGYYRRKEKFFSRRRVRRERLMQDPVALTKDGTLVWLSANVHFPRDLDDINRMSMIDVGLVKTEFGLIELLGSENPGNIRDAQGMIEKGMTNTLRRIIREFDGNTVSIRDLDLAGRDKVTHDVQSLFPDKDLGKYNGGIDFLMDAPELHIPFLRALFNASSYANDLEKRVRLVVPMVSSRRMLKSYFERLHETADAWSRDKGKEAVIPTAVIMFETPDAIRKRRDFLAMEEVDGGAIGTNDLIALTCGINRLSDEFPPIHPAIIEDIQLVAEAGSECGKGISVVGNAGFDPIGALVSVLAGIKRLSGASQHAPVVKELLTQLDREQHKELLEASKACDGFEELTQLWAREFLSLAEVSKPFSERPPWETQEAVYPVRDKQS